MMAATSSTFHVWKYEWFIRICLMSGNTKPLVAKWPCCFKDIYIYIYIFTFTTLVSLIWESAWISRPGRSDINQPPSLVEKWWKLDRVAIVYKWPYQKLAWNEARHCRIMSAWLEVFVPVAKIRLLISPGVAATELLVGQGTWLRIGFW